MKDTNSLKAITGLFVLAFAAVASTACVSTDNSDASAVEASASVDDAGYTPQHGWVESN